MESPEAAMIRREDTNRLNWLLSQIPAHEREMLLAHVADGKTWAEAGGRYMISAAQAKYLGDRGLRRIRRGPFGEMFLTEVERKDRAEADARERAEREAEFAARMAAAAARVVAADSERRAANYAKFCARGIDEGEMAAVLSWLPTQRDGWSTASARLLGRELTPAEWLYLESRI